jgi:pimeloyl-ACP methyl ester carboxylesterase
VTTAIETSAIEQRLVGLGDLRLNLASAGSGPLVIFCHGFPGLWYSWRHQLPALAAAGYRAVAIDQRGYGRSDRPVEPARYDANHLMDDVLGVIDALGERQAVVVGHDFGAQQVCNLAVRHRERIKAVVIMSCPYDFDLAGRGGRGRGSGTDAASGFATGVRPSIAFAAAAKDRFFHMHYFQSIGPPERELGGAPREFLTRLFWALSGEGGYTGYAAYPLHGTGYLDVLPPAPPLPWRWMSVADMDHYVAEFTRGGPDTAFIGGLNSYRVADRNWELGEPYADANIEIPALFVAGANDLVLKMIASDALDVMRARVPDLRGIELIPGAGHFVQMEQPAATNRALLTFLSSLD